jgi:hypothetical protein
VKEVLYEYESTDKKTSIKYTRPTVTPIAKRTTTPKNKVIKATAVPPIIYVAVPVGVVVFGMFSALLVTAFVYKMKPVTNHLNVERKEMEIVETLTRQQDVELGELKGKDYIKF